MSIKKHFYLIFLFGLSAAQSFSQSATDVQSILDKLSVKVKSAKGISSTFTLAQYDKSHHLTGSSKGIVKIKGNKYYVKQNETEIYCNGTQTWNFDGTNEVTVSKNDGSTETDISPQQVLTGFNKNDFTYKLVSSAGNNYEILLLPVDKRKNFKQVTIFINKSTNIVSKAKITDKSDNFIELNFSAINLNAVMPDSQFTFDASKHRGVEVINE
jgi:outer membrane lipoprotein carrier protein